MAWDDDKSTAADPSNPSADEQLTADEWDAHVSEGHFPDDELNLGVNGSGDPVVTDPQNGDSVVARYDRSEGAWVVDAITTEEASITKTSTFVTVSSADTLPSGTIVKIAFDTVRFDEFSAFDTANNKYVAAAAGTYFASLVLGYNGVGDQERVNAFIRKNGTIVSGPQYTASGTSFPQTAEPTAILQLSSGDEIDFAARSRDSDGSFSSTDTATYAVIGRLG